MVTRSFSAGIRALRARPGLAVLLYLLNLALAVLLAVPVGVALQVATAQTGFSPDLAQGLDIVLLTDIFEHHGDFMATMVAQLAWLLPLAAIWKAVLGVGLVHALRQGGGRGFWSGVGRYGGRAMLLALVYLAPIVVWIILVVVLGFVLTAIWGGEVAIFRVWFLTVPTLVITGLAVTDLMHDYARIMLVADEKPVFTAFVDGFLFPFRRGASSRLYVLWFIPAALLFALPTVVEAVVGATVLVFLLQQLLMFGRAGVTVAWFGSEVSLYEAIAPPPAIADAAVDEADPGLAVGLA